jgi:hypothetical protein
MLNIGQVVYDYTNEKVILFAGTQMRQCQRTFECTVESAFIQKDGLFIHLKGDKRPWFDYTNLIVASKPLIGSFVDKFELHGHYFGIIDGHDEEVKKAAKVAIEEAETLIAEYGLRKIETGRGDKKYTSCYIDVFE